MNDPLRRLARSGVVCVFACTVGLGLATLAAGAVTTTEGPKAASPSASCKPGFKAAVIGGNFKCLKVGQRCLNRYQTAYRKYGFVCVSGRLRKKPRPAPAPAPEPPPTPPPPPPAQAGHYKGQTSQLTNFEFDVTSDGSGVRSLITGQINEGCTPPAHLSGGEYNSGSATIPIASDGSFKIDFDYRGTLGGTIPTTGHLTITGHFSGAVATGNLSDSTNFTYQGVSFACGSGLQTWTASRTF